MLYEIWHYPLFDEKTAGDPADGVLIETIEAPDPEEAFFLANLVPAEVFEWDYDRAEDGSQGTHTNPDNLDDQWVAVRKPYEVEAIEISPEHQQLLARIARAVSRQGTVHHRKGDPVSAQDVLTDILNTIDAGIDRQGSWESGVIASLFGDLDV